MVEQLKVGDRITVDNGLINLEVLEIREHALRCRVLDGGTLGSRKHINLPGVRVNLPSITDKDRRDILFGIEHDVDFIALSFVRNAEAVLRARQLIEDAGGHHAQADRQDRKPGGRRQLRRDPGGRRRHHGRARRSGRRSRVRRAAGDPAQIVRKCAMPASR